MISQETMNLLIKYFQDYPELKGIPASSMVQAIPF